MADTGKIKEMKDREERCERARTRVSRSRHRTLVQYRDTT